MNYSVLDYLSMIGDPGRTGAYVRALRKMVTPESVVLDLGAGFGFFAVLAARLGARRAYAVERNDAIGLCPALARANGVEDRVTCFQGDARRVVLPERANILVEDIRGALPLQAGRIRLLRHARERLLTPDARLVATRERLWAAPARHPAPVQRDLATVGDDTFGVDLRPLRPHVVDGARRLRANADDLLLPGALLGTLDLTDIHEPNFDGTAHWSPDAPLTADGFVVWFDADLAEGEAFSAHPGSGQSVHGSLYLPLREPLAVPPGAQLALRFRGIEVGEDYLWSWECEIGTGSGSVLARTPRQSTHGALGVTRDRLSARSDQHRPALGPEGRRWRDAISLIDGQRSAGEIAQLLRRADAPSDGEDVGEWLRKVLDLIESGEVRQL